MDIIPFQPACARISLLSAYTSVAQINKPTKQQNNKATDQQTDKPTNQRIKYKGMPSFSPAHGS